MLAWQQLHQISLEIRMKVLTVFGTRPEAIKMCPLVLELKSRDNIECVVCVTGQHRSMLDQVLDIFDVKPDFDLDIMQPRQTITTITTSVLEKMESVLSPMRFSYTETPPPAWQLHSLRFTAEYPSATSKRD